MLWTQGKQKRDYSDRDLMQTGTATYNNLTASHKWNFGNVGSAAKYVVKSEKAKFLALTTRLEELGQGRKPRETNNRGDAPKTGWRFDVGNKPVGSTMTHFGVTYYVCDKDYHPQK